MAQCQWQPNFRTSISTAFKKHLILKCEASNIFSISMNRICNDVEIKKRSLLQKKNIVVQCTSSFRVSSTRICNVKGHAAGKHNEGEYEEEEECFVNDENGWKVRRMIEAQEETRKVATIQAEAFYEPGPIFNDVFLQFFEAEMLSSLLYRLKNSPPDRYACLVAEHSSDTPEVEKDLVGTVDATIYRESDVLQYLPGAEEYLYISGIAVLKKFRRQKVATALLKACDVLTRLWGFQYVVLRAHEDDFGARQLYENVGYVVIASDPPWKSTWIGRRKRVLMVKQIN